VPEPTIIVDAGPLVAMAAAEDKHHTWAIQHFGTLSPPFITCEPVLVEAFHLLWKKPGGVEAFFNTLDSDLLLVDMTVLAERRPLRKLAEKYQNVPMSLADACLVILSERHSKASVFTIDSHFHIYRKNGRQQIPLLMPP
jgi:predicted nucleic acid-binding protein